jgi:hypothetical protein
MIMGESAPSNSPAFQICCEYRSSFNCPRRALKFIPSLSILSAVPSILFPSLSIPYTVRSISFPPLQFPTRSTQFYSFPFNCPLHLLDSIPSPSIVRSAFFFPFQWSIPFGLLLDFPASINSLSRSPILFDITLKTMLVDSLGIYHHGLKCNMKGDVSLKMAVPHSLIFY